MLFLLDISFHLRNTDQPDALLWSL